MSEEAPKEGVVKLGSAIVREHPKMHRRTLCQVRTKKMTEVHELVAVQVLKNGTIAFDTTRHTNDLTVDDATQLARLLLEAVEEIQQNTSEETSNE